MLSISEIIAEADTLVPNPFEEKKKIEWLNEINKEFFEFVKIPRIEQFLTVAGTSHYSIPAKVQSNNVDKVQLNQALYDSMQYEEVKPGHNYWILDDETHKIQLVPKPYLSNVLCVVKYSQAASTTFDSTNKDFYPDAPKEYHFAYVLGLCERFAKAMNDVTLANNYGSDYRGQLSIAQQNYGTRFKGVGTE